MPADFLSLVHTLADTAREIALRYYRQPVPVEIKADASPVTLADRQIEERLRNILADQRPDDTVQGEEFDRTTGTSAFTWLIDPIDGTKSFVIGRPTFGTLITLCQGNTPVLGMMDFPVTGERWIGGRDQATTWNGRPVRTRSCSRLDHAYAGIYDPAYNGPLGNTWISRLTKAVRQMNWHGDCYFYGLIASGHMDLIVEPKMSPHDFLPMVPVIEGAGGRVTDWHGRPLTLKSEGHAVAVGSPDLLAQILPLLQK
ncbi:MAG: inositol monophosphatase family protein [Pseudomonadota bacterium]|nr:inositol monophosphatase family protein [Pseudomonadota bacterium]